MNDKPAWKPDEEEALKALIRETVKHAGDVDPSTLPSTIRERIKGRVRGEIDVDEYVRRVLAETKKK